MNILNIIKKAPKDHVYYCLINGDCYVEITNDEKYPITVRDINDTDWIGLTEKGKYFTDSETPDSECILFPSRDNRDWEAFERELMGITEGRQYVLRRVFGEEELPLSTEFEIEGGGKAVLSSFCGISGINLDHEYYKEDPYINFQIDGKEYKVSIEDMKRLAIGNTDNKTEHISCQSFDGTAEIVSIPDRPMMAAVIMSGMLAGGFKDKGAALINKAVNYADMILDYTKEGSNDKC